MNVIDNTPPEVEERPSGLLDRVRRSLLRSRTKSEVILPEVAVVNSLRKFLDNSYTLIRNVDLRESNTTIPMILIGTSGVKVLYPSETSGIYRAVEESWEKLDERKSKYSPEKLNLQTHVQLLADSVETVIRDGGYQSIVVDPVLLFTHPGTHVESVNASVRIILADGIERFAAGLLQSGYYVTAGDINDIVNLFVIPEIEEEEIMDEQPLERDFFSLANERENDSPMSTLLKRFSILEEVVPLLNKLPLTNREWKIIGLLVLVNIIILVVLVILVLMTT